MSESKALVPVNKETWQVIQSVAPIAVRIQLSDTRGPAVEGYPREDEGFKAVLRSASALLPTSPKPSRYQLPARRM